MLGGRVGVAISDIADISSSLQPDRWCALCGTLLGMHKDKEVSMKTGGEAEDCVRAQHTSLAVRCGAALQTLVRYTPEVRDQYSG